MSAQASERRASYDEIMADPMFKRGYHEIFDGVGSGVDIRWSGEEQLAYERGRQFGEVVKREEGVRLPLSKGYLAAPRAKLLLMMAFRDGDLRP